MQATSLILCMTPLPRSVMILDRCEHRAEEEDDPVTIVMHIHRLFHELQRIAADATHRTASLQAVAVFALHLQHHVRGAHVVQHERLVVAERRTSTRIKDGFKLNIMATSQAIMSQAASEGLITVLTDAGAMISASSCDLCFGYVQTVHDRQRAVSTGTLNTPGRMGSTTAEIYLCSAATVASTALTGMIADPRDHAGD